MLLCLFAEHYQLYVPESAMVGTAVGKIKAIDPDIGVNADMSYSIIDGDGFGIFTITTDKDTREGVIILKKVIIIYVSGFQNWSFYIPLNLMGC